MRLQTRIKLREIRRQLNKSDRQYYQLLKKSGEKESDCTGETWYADWMIAQIDAEAQEKTVISEELIYEAQKLYLPTPDLNDKEKWDKGVYENTFPRILTAETMTALRATIRKERMERRAEVESWFKILGGAIGILTGLVGALIGLIAIWKR